MLRCHAPLRGGVTVVIVNWETLNHLRTTVGAVRRFSPASTRMLVVDNGSSDGSVDWLRQHGVRTVTLDRNLGHGTALDLGWLRARTQTVVALDVDAFPINESWLSCLTTPLEEGSTVVGAHYGEVLERVSPDVPPEWRGRDFVHPCCLAMRLRRFVQCHHSFRGDWSTWTDVGESISSREREHLSFLEPTSHIGPGPVGTVFGDVVYHNFYAARHRREGRDRIHGVTEMDAISAWNTAVATYLA